MSIIHIIISIIISTNHIIIVVIIGNSKTFAVGAETLSTFNEIQIFNCVWLFQDQYTFVYEALLEGIHTGNTTILSSDFNSEYIDLLVAKEDSEESTFEQQFEVK